MRATGGTLKFRRSNSSRRSCQMWPIAKPSASAAKISKAITTARLIELSPLGQGHYPATQRLLNPFWQDTRGAALGGDGSVDHSASTSWISSDSPTCGQLLAIFDVDIDLRSFEHGNCVGAPFGGDGPWEILR